MVVSPPDVFLTVLAKSRNDVANFHLELKNNYPGLGFRVVTVHEISDDGQKLFAADFEGKYQVGRGNLPGQFSNDMVAAQAIQGEIKKIAQSNKIGISYYKQGNASSSGNVNCYVAFSGESGNVLTFLDSFIRALPQIRIDKIALDKTPKKSTLSVRADFTYYR